MASADLELQGAIVARLKADTSLSEIIADRVYDRIPAPVACPYIHIGEAQTLRADATCVFGSQVYLTLHAWSRAVGVPEVKRIADRVETALHLAPLSLPTNRLISIMHRQTRIFTDADGLTSHAVVDFVASTEKP